MNSFLLYIIESTICIVIFYFLNRILVKKDSDFAVIRVLLLSFVIASLIIPIIKIPYFMQKATPQQSVASIQNSSFDKFFLQKLPTINITEKLTAKAENKNLESLNKTDTSIIPFKTILLFIYLSGVLINLLILVRNIVTIQLIFQKAPIKRMNGFRLRIVDRDIYSFTFLKTVVISKSDYELSGSYILAHELAHIKFNHFYDLILLETVKIIFWFNPVIYFLINDLKQIHEFQADKHTLQSGLDAVQYQLLMIKKVVGPRRFAFANSFNQSQIKKRIIMIKNQKKQQKFSWKFMAYFIIAAILIVAFSSFTEKPSDKTSTSQDIKGAWKYVISQEISNGITNTVISEKSAASSMKIWADDYFAFVGHFGMGGSFGGSGKYKLNGTDYEETVLFSPGQNDIGRIIKLKLEIKNDTLTQIWPVDDSGNYDIQNYNIIKMVRMK